MHVYINDIYINKLGTGVDGDPKAQFSIATTRCREGYHSFPMIDPLYP